MSGINITPYFPFSRVKITGHKLSSDGPFAVDLRYRVLCHRCASKGKWIHSHSSRYVRDLNFTSVKVYLNCRYRKVFCPSCGGIRIEAQEFVEPYARVTKRLACYVYELCKVLTVFEVAHHMSLDWKTVKAIDKSFLENDFGKTDYDDLRMLAVDEISIRKGHNYLTVVLDYQTGRIVWIGKGRTEKTLDAFFKGMTDEQRAKIQAIAIDMWSPYIKAIHHWCPKAKIVFDLFHVLKEFSKAIDKVRNREYRKSSQEGKNIIKGSKYLLLKNRQNLREDERSHLRELLDLNENLNTMYILKKIWTYRYRKWAQKRIFLPN